MNTNDRTIIKNASVMMVTQVFTWGLALLTTLFLPRYLGANGLGQFHLATSIWAMVGIIAAFGMDAVVIKEIARDPARTAELFTNTALVRSIFFIIGSAVVALYSHWAGYPTLTVQVIMIIGISQFIGYLTAACQSSLQGLERMEFSSLGQAVERTLVTLASIGLLLLGFGVLSIALINVVGSLVGLTIQFVTLNRLQKLRFQVDIGTIKWLLKTSVPFLLFSSFIVIYGQIDTIIISLLVNEQGVGWYSVTDRLYGTFLFIPTIFISAAYPALSRLFTDDANSLARLIRKSFELMVLIAVPIGLGLSMIADPLVILLFGADFQKSGPILSLRAVILIFTYLNMLIGMFLLSIDKQKAWAIVMGVATLVSIPLDIVLVPWCERIFNNGAMGGAFSYMVTESAMLLAALILLPKGLLTRANGWYAARVLLAGLGMLAVTWWSREMFLGIPLTFGAASYLLFLVVLRVLTKEEWYFIKKLSASVLHRVTGRLAQPANLS